MAVRRADARAAASLAQRSPWLLRLFGFIFERTLKADFHAARIARAMPPPPDGTPRLVIYTNHPSWWDGVTYVMLAKHLYPSHKVYTPVDAEMVRHYGFVGRIGSFGVDLNARRGAADFIATSKAVLNLPDGLLIVATQGRFADVRERPLRCGPGIAHLCDHVAGISLVPLAIEYVFWNERQPELLLRFGAPICGDALRAQPAGERLMILERALEAEMDALAADAIARRSEAFNVWIEGTLGVNPVFDAWRRARAWMRGERYAAEHGKPK
jgi:1-acyl-sn-glycerol-3-phosphate acyltransferase